ncbi:hypothetical protein F8R90_17150 [Nostoc sp. NZL]|nr:hypothetical protein [Nostoc sp. NZL]
MGIGKRQGRQGRGGRQGRNLFNNSPLSPLSPSSPPALCSLLPCLLYSPISSTQLTSVRTP